MPQIFIKTPTHGCHVLDVPDSTTILEVKDMVQKKVGLPCDLEFVVANLEFVVATCVSQRHGKSLQSSTSLSSAQTTATSQGAPPERTMTKEEVDNLVEEPAEWPREKKKRRVLSS